METIRIDILNPKAKALLKDLANLDLIRIRKESSQNEFSDLLKNFRKNSDEAPSLEEITKEVEEVRKARYAK
jgi:methyl-accepting chemotaxis protein